MTPSVALVIWVIGIAGLFALESERGVRVSAALWLPTAWLLVAGSRSLSTWLQGAQQASPEQLLEGSPIDRNLYIVLMFFAMLVLVHRSRAVGSILQKNWPILLFVLYCAVSVIWSDYPDVALKRWFKSLGDYAMILIVLTDQDQKAALKRVLTRASFLLLPLSILLIKYYPQWGRTFAAHYDSTQFYVGVAENKNMLGMTCLVFGLAAVWRFFQELSTSRRKMQLIVHGTVVGMALWLLQMADSKTSLACLLMASAVVVATSMSRLARKRAVVHFLVFGIVAVSFSVLFLNVGSGALDAMGRNSTLTGRTDIWDAVLDVPVNPVVGTGFESFWLGDRLTRLWAIPVVDGITEAHNGYLEVYVNLGWIGVALIALLLFTAYRNTLRVLSRDSEAGCLMLGYFVVAVTYNFTEAAIRTTDLVWLAFLLVAIALPEQPGASESAQTVPADTPALVEAAI